MSTGHGKKEKKLKTQTNLEPSLEGDLFTNYKYNACNMYELCVYSTHILKDEGWKYLGGEEGE